MYIYIYICNTETETERCREIHSAHGGKRPAGAAAPRRTRHAAAPGERLAQVVLRHEPRTILYYTILYYTILCYAMLCYAMICYAMLCFAMICFAMRCYAML